jgi:hypothetical protein
MTTKASAKKSEEIVDFLKIEEASITFHIVGTTPLILNRMTSKVWQQLLGPSGRKTAADKATSLKHDPVAEFRSSPYRLRVDDAPTLLALLPTMFKQAMGTAALDTPGMAKSKILRLLRVDWDRIAVWGHPFLHMAITRNSDINHTPDVRTRCILPAWATELTLHYPPLLVRPQGLANLLHTAGISSGVGEWRQGKGSGSFGGFRVCAADDPEYLDVKAHWGRSAQLQAMEDAEPFDEEAEEALDWFEDEVIGKRGRKATVRQSRDISGDDGIPPPVGATKGGYRGNGAAAEGSA